MRKSNLEFLTFEEKSYLENYLGIICNKDTYVDVENVLVEIEKRIYTVQNVLNCLGDKDKFLLNRYGEEKNDLETIKKKIMSSSEEKNADVKIEIMKNALDMYIRDTSEKIIFIHDNMGNNSGLMKHFKEMLDIAKGMKMKL